MQPFRLFAATGDAVARLGSRDGESVDTVLNLEGSGAQCVAVDPHEPNRVFVGTFDNGVYRTLDGGATWTAVGEAMPDKRVLSMVVSPCDRAMAVRWSSPAPSRAISIARRTTARTWQPSRH